MSPILRWKVWCRCHPRLLAERPPTGQPLLPEVVEGEVPEATWVVDAAEWSLAVTWAEAGCIENHWTYRFTVTAAELIAGRSVATAFVGTWVQANSGDCLGSWELVDEWSLVGSASG